MNITLWILASLLAAMFLASGIQKMSQSKKKLAAGGYGWVEDFSGGGVKGIGALEVLGAVGMILPAVVDVAPVLVPVAATGLALLMLGAITVHIRRREAETRTIAVPLTLLVLAALVAWGRFGPESFTA